MPTTTDSRVWRTIPLLITICLFSLPAYAKYSGGTGEPNNPYQIATAADLIALGETPEDYDKHFILTADIDLDPNLPGRKVFDRAVIAPDTNQTEYGFQGTAFAGVLVGNAHTISHLTIVGRSYVGLFGGLVSGAEVKNLGVVDVNITSCDDYVGALVGSNGDLWRGAWGGIVTQCYSTGAVSGRDQVGGLVGNNYSIVAECYSSGAVRGDDDVGGLVGRNCATVSNCYCSVTVSGSSSVGGLVGNNDIYPFEIGCISQCYSAGPVVGKTSVGGLVGYNAGDVLECFWDTQTSGQDTSAGGTGKTTYEMQDPNTFTAAGWDFVGQLDGPQDIWAEPIGGGYPILWWQLPPLQGLPRFSGGTGETNDPYRISTAGELNSIGHNPRLMECHFKLVDDIDLAAIDLYSIGDNDRQYNGVFDGNGKTVRNLRNSLFGCVNGLIKDLRFLNPQFISPIRANRGTIACCSVQGGSISGYDGLVGSNYGTVTQCYSTGIVSGVHIVGGLVGYNDGFVTQCYSTAAVCGGDYVGGLVGVNGGTVTRCYSTGVVNGTFVVGGLVGSSLSQVGDVFDCFWNTETSEQSTSAGGTGLTTTEMQTAKTFLDAGWDFVGEMANGTQDIWWILEGKDYPRLWWESK